VLPPRSAPDQAPPVLRVATGVVAPFVMEQDGVLIGFSIDLWSAIAKRLGVQTMLVNTGPRDTPGKRRAGSTLSLARGECDTRPRMAGGPAQRGCGWLYD
jgi:hypothetical protein